MKRIYILAISFLFFTASTYASNLSTITIATDTIGKNDSLVIVKRWSSRGIIYFSNYFKETKDEIIQQIGEAEFEKVQQLCSSSSWPVQMNDTQTDEKLVEEKMNKLKMYKIAVYQHKYNGNLFEREVILKVPFSENEYWDENAQWEGSVYFILNEADIEVVK